MMKPPQVFCNEVLVKRLVEWVREGIAGARSDSHSLPALSVYENSDLNFS